MTGQELKQLIELSDYTITELAKKWDVSREHLSREIFKSREISPHYERLASEAGLLVYREKIKAPVASVIAQEVDRLQKKLEKVLEDNKKLKKDNKWLRERLTLYKDRFGAIGYNSTQLKAMAKTPDEQPKQKKIG